MVIIPKDVLLGNLGGGGGGIEIFESLGTQGKVELGEYEICHMRTVKS